MSPEEEKAFEDGVDGSDWVVPPKPDALVIAELRTELMNVLWSATPHPVHNPTMWSAWKRAEALLGIPPELTRTLGTCDKALEARLLAAPGRGPSSPDGGAASGEK